MTFDDAQRAAYIDFESLRTGSAAPTLLGILEWTGAAPTFEQHVLDPVLATAAVARRCCRVTSVHDAIARLVEVANSNDTAIVGWGPFERDVIDASNLPSPLKAAFRDRYVSGRALATRWKNTIYPTLKIERDGPFDPRNRLDRFARISGYPDVAKLTGRPAAWIRHVVGQLTAAGGRYRRMRPEAVRDWRLLLDYNEHDCKALRHIVVRAVFELAKWREYRRTTYCAFTTPRRPVCFHAGSRSARLDALLDREGADRWAFITAWNPGSQVRPQRENDRRQAELMARLKAYRTIIGEGRGRDGAWPPEPSVLVLGITASKAMQLGMRFGQLAILVGRRGQSARLVFCSPL